MLENIRKNMSSLKDAKDGTSKLQNLKSPSLQDIKDAARNIASKAIKTPLVKLNLGTRNENKKESNVRCLPL